MTLPRVLGGLLVLQLVVLAVLVGVLAAGAPDDPPPVPESPSPDVVARLPAPESDSGLAVSPDGARLYVSDLNGRAVTVLDTATGAQVGSIDLPEAPLPLTISADGRRAVMPAHDEAEIYVLDLRTGEVTATVPVRHTLSPVAITRDGRRAFVGHPGGVEVVDLDAGEVIGLIDVPLGYTSELALSGDDRTLYTTGDGRAAVSVVDTARGRRVGDLPGVPWAPYIAVSPDGARVYVAGGLGDLGGRLAVDVATGTGAPVAGTGGSFLTVSHDGRRLYVVEALNGVVDVVDTATLLVVRRLMVGARPSRLVLSPDDRTAWVVTGGERRSVGVVPVA